jgi:hypothetical protein
MKDRRIPPKITPGNGETGLFFSTLFRHCQERRFITSLANLRHESKKYPFASILTLRGDRAERFVRRYDKPGRATYACVSTLIRGAARRNKHTLAELACLHVDIDSKGVVEDAGTVARVLASLPLPPTMTVLSGHGVHAYWRFNSPIVATPESIVHIEGMLRRLVAVLAGDPACAHEACLMRVPGSHNSKRGEWLEVRIDGLGDNDYGPGQLERWLASETNSRLRRKSAGGETIRYGVRRDSSKLRRISDPATWDGPVNVAERLAKMQHQDPIHGVHLTQLSVTAAMLLRGYSIDHVVAVVLEATMDSVGCDREWDWPGEREKIEEMCVTWLAKHPVFTYEDLEGWSW